MKQIRMGIDIGGTYVKGVLIEADEITCRLKMETRDGREDWQRAIADMHRELTKKASGPVEAIGLSAPGIASADNRSIAYMPVRLQGLEGFNWSDYLAVEVHVLNDAHAALWAEARLGTGKGKSNLVMITLGTGVGGGLLLNGQLYQGFMQRAGHLGHISVDAASITPSITGITGSLEDAIGEAGLAARSLQRFTSTFDLVQAHRAGDSWATYLWLDSVRKLALAIASFCNAFSPDLVILAGGITKAGEDLLQPLATFLDLYEWRPGGRSTPVKLAEFQDYAGAIGAALYDGPVPQ
ncbi:ROK family protein [Flavilitoribacter nigricans]|uniref:Sugar kinase n=1 Tax=Flavilitoribacter nigricans (strain ATCC 23147 / DSM 23189 / NBRC 102662 / NCIMB 1420 / SS-2) TaxID=1122177 RepID=A0A2D0NJB6_FLAN2|nr:ROK family protein [Flavilitoribacter nigricans]PHN07843.1 sugar kinase [Flavilitoribacter nigricans DSM 23189 = NBRC 102662]